MRILKAALLGALIASPATAAEIQAFKPTGPTVLVAGTTTAASTSLPTGGGSFLVYNACTTQIARVDFSGNAATTPVAAGANGSLGIPPATLVVLEVGTFATSVSVKLDAIGPCNVEITRGEGMAH